MNAAAAVATLAALVYLPSLAGPFQFDDHNVIAGGGVRPLLQATYALNRVLDPGPLGFHALNIAAHALNAALLVLVGRRLFPAFPGAVLAAGLLFALHPMQTEAVTYISGRSSSLMACFYLGAMLYYLRGGHWLAVAALFLCALATRETAVTLPAALLLCELVRGTPWRVALRRQAALWLMLAAGALVVLLHPGYFELVTYGFLQRSLADNLITQVGGVSYLVSRLITLHGLNIDPGLPALNAWTPTIAFQAICLLSLGILGVLQFRARPWIAFGVLWFFLQLAPTNSVVPRLDVANDRQVYLACWGLFLALSIQLAQAPLSRLAAAGIVVLFASTSIVRQLDYIDAVTLWEASVRASPWNARAHNNLGYAYYQAGRKAEAWQQFQTALLFEPQHAKARANLLLLDFR